MARKLSDMKETAKDAVEIVRELRNPEVKETLGQLRGTVDSVKEIVELFADPAIVKNIENISRAAESLKNVSTDIHDSVRQLNESGVLKELSETINAAKSGISLATSKEGPETIHAVSDMFESLRSLVAEISVILSSTKLTKKSAEVSSAFGDTAAEAVKIYKNLAE